MENVLPTVITTSHGHGGVQDGAGGVQDGAGGAGGPDGAGGVQVMVTLIQETHGAGKEMAITTTLQLQ